MSAIAQLKSMLNQVPGGVGIYRLGFRQEALYLNDAFFEMMGYTREAYAALAKNPRDPFILPEDRPIYEKMLQLVHKQGSAKNCVYRVMRPDGSLRWIQLNVSTMELDDTAVYFAAFTDITAAGDADGSLRYCATPAAPPDESRAFQPLSERAPIAGQAQKRSGREACGPCLADHTEIMCKNRQLMKLLNRLPGGIGFFELTGKTIRQLYLNDGFFQMLGDTRENCMHYSGERFFQEIYPEDRALFKQIYAGLLHGEKQLKLTCRMRGGGGAYLWVHLAGTVEKDDEGRTILCCSFSDVDQRMRVQLALQKDQIMFKLAMQTAKMSSWEFDVIHKCIHQNGPSQLQHGYGRLVENVPESLIADGFVHPSSAGIYRRLFTAVTRDQGTLQGDACVRTVDRKGYWWERIIMTPVFDRDGRHIRSIGTTIDITEQKVLETKYLQQVQTFNSANSSSLIAKALYNLSSGNMEHYHGQTKSAVHSAAIRTYEDGLNGTAELFVNPEEAQKFLTQFNRHALLRQFSDGNAETVCEYQRKNADGRIIWAQTTGKLYAEPVSGDVMCFIYSYDINEQKTAQDMIDTVVRVDYDYLALLDCRTLDYTVYANSENLRTPLPPFHSSNYEQEVREYARMYLLAEDAEQNIHDMSVANIRAQLETRDSFVAYAAMREKDGTVSRKKLQFSYLDRTNEKVLITRVDVTDIYKREQEQSEKLRAANRAKAEFLSHMSHDLRTPMNAIIGLSELAQDELDDPQAMKSYVENIRSAGQFLLGLVSDCLDFEKLTAHKMQLHNVPYPYQEFRDSMTIMIEPLCRKKRIEFIFTQSAPYTVCVDKIRFEQIFFNLLSNAVKYTPEGGKVSFTADSRLNGDKSLVICDFYVRDNGIGMSEEFQKRLFKPFEQEAAGALSPQPGTGLGLSIVKKLVELMGGAIHIRSRRGEGTEVMVHLEMPNVAGEEEPLPKHLSGSEQEGLAGKTILLLEDQSLNMMIAKKLLEKHGARVLCAENGRLGLERFAASLVGFIDAILTDIRMPVMDGLELARAIRALARADAQTVPIIAMTANAFEEDVQETRRAGMDAHLSKPIDPELLYGTLQSCILSGEAEKRRKNEA